MSTDTRRPWWRAPLRFIVAIVVGVATAGMLREGATEAGQVLGYGEARILAVLVAILFDQTSELGAK